MRAAWMSAYVTSNVAHSNSAMLTSSVEVHMPATCIQLSLFMDAASIVDAMFFTGDDEFTADDGVILAHKKENVYIGENEDNRTTAAVKKRKHVHSQSFTCAGCS